MQIKMCLGDNVGKKPGTLSTVPGLKFMCRPMTPQKKAARLNEQTRCRAPLGLVERD